MRRIIFGGVGDVNDLWEGGGSGFARAGPMCFALFRQQPAAGAPLVRRGLNRLVWESNPSYPGRPFFCGCRSRFVHNAALEGLRARHKSPQLRGELEGLFTERKLRGIDAGVCREWVEGCGFLP